jgi:hypothetical protein
MAVKSIYPSTKSCHQFSINDEYDNDNDGDDDDDDGDDDDDYDDDDVHNDDDDDDDDGGGDDDDGIITKRKARCMKIVHATITNKYSIKNLVQTCASGKKRKHIAGCQSQLASMDWVLTCGTCQK